MRRLGIGLRIISYGTAMLVSIAAGLEALEVIQLWQWLSITVVVASALIAFLGSLLALVHQERTRQQQQRAAKVREIALATFQLIIDKTGLNGMEMGYGVYKLRRRWINQFRDTRDDGSWTSVMPFWPRTVIEPIDRWRPLRSPAATHERWYKGMGVIGLCIERRAEADADIPGIYDRNPPGMTKDQWLATVGEDDRMGMTFDEWERARGVALPVRAVPMCTTQNGKKKCRACFAIEGPRGEYDAITTTDVTDLLLYASSSVRNILYTDS